MRIRYILYLLLSLIGFTFVQPSEGSAETNQKVIVIYSMNEEEQLKQVRILDTLIGQFTNDYTFVQDDMLHEEDVADYSRLIYLGAGKMNLSEHVTNAINEYVGPVFMIGHNAEQFKRNHTWLHIQGEVIINQITLLNSQANQLLPEDRIMYQVNNEIGNVLMTGFGKQSGQFPLLLDNEGDFYFAAQSLFSPVGEALTEALGVFLGHEETKHIRYLRLEDIHPKVDAAKLKKQATYLKQKNIPYMVAVIPVYMMNGKTVHLSDSPELVKTLKYMQNNGASIVLHGYKHQYRDSETGEGFEFWDVEYDRPIYQPATEKAFLRKDYPSEKKYESFIEEGKEFEKTYIKNALRNGVAELVAHGLYPLAFEAPHYAMSQQGYNVISEYFSSYIGRLQLTDQTWQSEYVPMYETQPKFMNGLTLYPETVGFIEQGNDKAFAQLQQSIKTMKEYNKSYISAFYHPYLGKEGLKKVVEELERVENATWLDLKKRENSVEIDEINITSKDGKVEISKPFISSEYERNVKIKQSLKYILPSLLVVAVLIVLIRKRKRRE
ncbi:DUF2334 domain-containing protein [Virgibacillus halodenitrificans]|uniref:DUF2334 domain-containing protein n=1 Tax=Virgibacillus halodenitrificans TaxID=1482 RepID=UPI0007617298